MTGSQISLIKNDGNFNKRITNTPNESMIQLEDCEFNQEEFLLNIEGLHYFAPKLKFQLV